MNPLKKYIRPLENTDTKDKKLHLNIDIYSKALLAKLVHQTTKDDIR